MCFFLLGLSSRRRSDKCSANNDENSQDGKFQTLGAAVSAIEVALWDIAGKAAGAPVYKLLGGKIRDQGRCYNGSVPVKKLFLMGSKLESSRARIYDRKDINL